MSQPTNVWGYSRSSDRHPHILFQQTEKLLHEAERRGYTVAGASQDMGTGRSMVRQGLRTAMRAVRSGSAHAILVRDLSRLSHERISFGLVHMTVSSPTIPATPVWIA